MLYSGYLIKTKVHRSSVPDDAVIDTDLIDKPESNQQKPILLFAATTSNKRFNVSQNIEQTIVPDLWISLDKEYNKLRTYLEYILRSLINVFTEILSNLILKFRTCRFAIINNTRRYSTK